MPARPGPCAPVALSGASPGSVSRKSSASSHAWTFTRASREVGHCPHVLGTSSAPNPADSALPRPRPRMSPPETNTATTAAPRSATARTRCTRSKGRGSRGSPSPGRSPGRDLSGNALFRRVRRERFRGIVICRVRPRGQGAQLVTGRGCQRQREDGHRDYTAVRGSTRRPPHRPPKLPPCHQADTPALPGRSANTTAIPRPCEVAPRSVPRRIPETFTAIVLGGTTRRHFRAPGSTLTQGEPS